MSQYNVLFDEVIDEMDINHVYIGKKIKELRENRNLSRPGLCADLLRLQLGPYELLPRTLKAWETGQNRPDMSFLPAFCKYFDTDMSYFFDDSRIAKEKIVEDICGYIGLNEKAVIALRKWSASSDGNDARDSVLLSGFFQLLPIQSASIMRRLKALSLFLGDAISGMPIESSEIESYIVTAKLELLQVKETRQKMHTMLDAWLDEYADYAEIVDHIQSALDALEKYAERDMKREEDGIGEHN